jgi:hypothetical protein
MTTKTRSGVAIYIPKHHRPRNEASSMIYTASARAIHMDFIEQHADILDGNTIQGLKRLYLNSMDSYIVHNSYDLSEAIASTWGLQIDGKHLRPLLEERQLMGVHALTLFDGYLDPYQCNIFVDNGYCRENHDTPLQGYDMFRYAPLHTFAQVLQRKVQYKKNFLAFTKPLALEGGKEGASV